MTESMLEAVIKQNKEGYIPSLRIVVFFVEVDGSSHGSEFCFHGKTYNSTYNTSM